MSLAATWNQDLLYEVGQHLADEVKARSAHILLAPTVCMHRHPLGGRNFESFSEDPLLTGKLAAQYIQGLQQKGVAATIKRSWLRGSGLMWDTADAWNRFCRKRAGDSPTNHKLDCAGAAVARAVSEAV